MAFRHILVPIDFGLATDAAIELALSIATPRNARVALVHAVEILPFVNPSPFVLPRDPEPVRGAFEVVMNRLCEKTRARWAKVDSVVHIGDVHAVILAVAKAQACDLMVVGTRGRRSVPRVVLGSVAEKLLRLSSIPVLTVRPDTPNATPAAAA